MFSPTMFREDSIEDTLPMLPAEAAMQSGDGLEISALGTFAATSASGQRQQASIKPSA